MAIAAVAALLVTGSLLWPEDHETAVIVQGADLGSAAEAVREAGGEIAYELKIIDAVAARIPADQRARLESRSDLRVYDDHSVTVAAKGGKYRIPDTHFPDLVGASALHDAGIYGDGVTVAILDTGFVDSETLDQNLNKKDRIVGGYLVSQDRDWADMPFYGDMNGHGTHVTSVVMNSQLSDSRHPTGIAPNAGLVIVVAFNGLGNGTYGEVIRGIDWVVQNKDRHNIRVLNCSFSAPPQSHYWDDPLNQAIMRAWEAGIVVVASAGNKGPDPMTIGVPGNVPYVITVGAMSDNFTPADGSDDVLASFSSTGPTYEGFVKPEVVAPGGHMLGLMSTVSKIATDHPEFHDGGQYFSMSGTSQAAAAVSGVVALMLQVEPYLTPDDVKCKLMASARPAVKADGTLAYSVFQQGAGLVNAHDAVYATDLTCANRGLDVAADVEGSTHFRGRANRDESGSYYIEGLDGFIWSDGYTFTDGFIWSDGYVFTEGFVFTDGFIFTDSFIWSDTYVWSDTFVWSDALSEPASINVWVPQE
jgi:serine protease AprX